MFAEVEKRLRCEQMFGRTEKRSDGQFDEALREALIRFQHKNMLYDAAALRPDTLAALGRTPLENDRASLERALDRAGGLRRQHARGRHGQRQEERGADLPEREPAQRLPVRNLVEEALKATRAQLASRRRERAAFFARHPAEDFRWLKVAVKLPAVPEYYGPSMELSVLIDSGDVFYDPPFDEKGKPVPQVRKHFPLLTLNCASRAAHPARPLAHHHRRVALGPGVERVRILSLQGLDVGPRVWRNIVSGPVWIAPNSTPIRTLVKSKLVHGQLSRW